MKHLLYFLLLTTTIAFSNNQKPTSTSINEVTVYVNGAQIIRTAKITLPIGTTTFKFDKLSPNIQESSIQISGLKSASILSINYGINYLSKQNKSETIETLQNRMMVLKDNIQSEDDLISGYEEELKIIHDNRHIGNENEAVTLEKLQQFANYYRKRITEIKNLIHLSNKKKREMDEQISEIQKQLTEFNVVDKVQTGEITIKLNTIKISQLDLIIKYNVDNAGWFPIYDIKADKINNPLQLSYKAHVYQSTGSNWDDVKLTLSTSDPNTNNEKPEINPKYLNFISRYSNYRSSNATKNYNYKYNPFVQTVSGIVTDETGAPLPGANIIVKGTSNGAISDFDGKYSIKTNGEKELVFSYIGYKSETLPIHSSIMNINLEADIAQLDEVVVTGYATAKNRSISGSVAGVKIRGASNSTNSANPLIIIDGVISSQNDLSHLDPNLVVSTEVLKDKASTAVYGSRGNNGVILVTTKKETYTSNGDVIEEGITNRRFEIKKSYTIPSDGDITVIEIDKYEIPATYAYFAAPVINENVFLTAKMSDWEQYNLLPGEANIYFDGSYSGKTNINPQATTDSLTVSLGVDPNVVVKRNTINNFKKNNLIGNNKIINKNYEIELKNNKQSAISLILMDRVPVSQNREIKVDDIDYGVAEFDSKKGLLKWKINLKPNYSNKFSFSYTLKYPKYKRVNL
ncbi:mucoidy inhibitor MuiA family protein [Flavivirga aquimarina]|uniref:Mucoidy inhibitor MuiA family protein n=1 Tax=Flavivirga aquimarina TaxID=2027862 RepID=A0ABT8W689_9FLAO|nr:mucoidy inhibitor MuiA family protein [Flavivirga aquimarina]MDO5968628.1 mucoidy inhibitor MuiA family protein [Flavivirga aquimarina]